jgi:DnaJ-class molecular chaperone
MDNIKIKEIEPKYYAQICPNCNGRGHVGYDKRPCPTCGNTNHKGIVYVPVKDERNDNKNNLY